MTVYVEMSTFYPLLEEHGLSRWWIYKQWQSMGTYKWVRDHLGRKRHALVPKQEMEARILIASKRPGIAPILKRLWNVLVGRRMTHLVSKSHGTWQRHYGLARARCRMVITTPEDLLFMQPRFLFFHDYLEQLEPVISNDDFVRLNNYLKKVERQANKIISEKSHVYKFRKILSEINYEDFYNHLLDNILYGQSVDKSFLSAISDTALYYDTLSSYEIQPDQADTIEKTAVSESEIDQIFHIDFQKLKKEFFRSLLDERLLNASKRTQSRARKQAGLDMAIFLLHLQQATDEEIRQRLHFAGSRQRMTQRRLRVLEKARGVFSVLRE